MADVLAWSNTEDDLNLLQQARSVLESGKLVVLPSESGYLIAGCARSPESMAGLLSFAEQNGSKLQLSLLRSPEQMQTLPLGAVGEKLARRCWPGPLTIQPEPGHWSQWLTLFCEDAQSRITGSGLRCPAHVTMLWALQKMQEPIAFVDLPGQGTGRAFTAADAIASAGEAAALVIDGGAVEEPELPTTIQLTSNGWSILEEGSWTDQDLQAQMAHLIVFVCTGNTCRSPLAEVLCKKTLAERLGCPVEELPDRGFVVMSAGVNAFEGAPASPESVAIAREQGLELSSHCSQGLHQSLAQQADTLVCMTNGHLESVLSYFPEIQDRARLLSSEGQDLPDPIGQTIEIYRKCAEQIQADLVAIADELIAKQVK